MQHLKDIAAVVSKFALVAAASYGRCGRQYALSNHPSNFSQEVQRFLFLLPALAARQRLLERAPSR